MKQLQIDRIASPLGELVLVVDEGRLCALDYPEYDARTQHFLRRRYGPFVLSPAAAPASVRAGLIAYFGGVYGALDDIPVIAAGTPFQQQVWQALRTIPPGTAWTYGQLAARLGRPSAARAVGLANSMNPVAIVLPCHRLVGADGTLTGYAGGLTRKRWLLRHEGVVLAAQRAEAQAEGRRPNGKRTPIC